MIGGLEASLLLAGGAAAAVKIHDFFEGETLLRDCTDEWRLGRLSLHQLDRAWRSNERRSEAIVSLTTIPSRLPLIGPTLKSLMRQRLAPRRIVLNLPRFSRREGVSYEIPESLEGLESVEIRRVEDIGPATKLLPSLTAEKPSQPIIVVDDDRIYPACLVEDLMAAADREPRSAFGMSGWVVPPDLTDRPTTAWSNFRKLPPAPVRARRLGSAFEVDILQGLSGYLVRPAFFNLAAVSDYGNAPPAAFFVDDVWISAHLRTRRFVIPSRRGNYQPKLSRGLYRRTSLGLINRGPGPDAQRNNSIVIRHFANCWMTSRAPAADVPNRDEREAEPSP